MTASKHHKGREAREACHTDIREVRRAGTGYRLDLATSLYISDYPVHVTIMFVRYKRLAEATLQPGEEIETSGIDSNELAGPPRVLQTLKRRSWEGRARAVNRN